MILTLTPNTAFDLTVVIPKFTPDRTIRATQTYHSMGGKPTDASWILGRMGETNLALGLSAGAIGEKVKGMLNELGVITDFVEADGETRINTVILDKTTGEQTTITTASMSVNETHLTHLREKYVDILKNATVLITGGSLPSGVPSEFYTEVIQLAHEHHVPVIFDVSEPNLSIGLKAKPTFIKPNKDELSTLVGHGISTIEEAYRIGQDILQQYGTQSVITFGQAGALAILKDCAYRIPPIGIDVQSAAGAGDAVLAGLAHSIHHGHPIEDGLRLGIATATAVCLQVGTAAYDVADMERFLPQVELILYPSKT
jgi:1-phosphofructokinase family hexose kinase